jgi:hypothetical protein
LLLLADIGLIAGLVYYVNMVNQDWEYWQRSPYPFHIFMVIQYILIALAIRVPLFDMRSQTQTQLMVVLVSFLIVNTIYGIYMLNKLTSCENAECTDDSADASKVTGSEKAFVLKDNYILHGIILILLPASVFIFLVIVLVKLLFFVLVDKKKGKNSGVGANGNYGQFDDDSEDLEAVEAVVSVYFKIMDQVVYKTYKDPETN